MAALFAVRRSLGVYVAARTNRRRRGAASADRMPDPADDDFSNLKVFNTVLWGAGGKYEFVLGASGARVGFRRTGKLSWLEVSGRGDSW